MALEPRIDEAGGGVDQQTEASQAGFPFESGDDVVGEGHHFESGSEHELAGMEHEGCVHLGRHLGGEIRLRLLRSMEG